MEKENNIEKLSEEEKLRLKTELRKLEAEHFWRVGKIIEKQKSLKLVERDIIRLNERKKETEKSLEDLLKEDKKLDKEIQEIKEKLENQ